ncbi:hypothetical protein D3C73_1674680 [compost metagenome]
MTLDNFIIKDNLTLIIYDYLRFLNEVRRAYFESIGIPAEIDDSIAIDRRTSMRASERE